MRIAVIGAGAVGGTIAALLDRGGHDVEVTARGDNLEAIRANGLALSGAWGDHVARVEANERLTRAPQLAVVATKALDAASALRDNAEWLRGIPVVVVQNGLHAVTTARRVLRHSDIVGGLALFAASYLSPAVVAVTTDGSTCLGNERNGLEVRYAADVLGAVMPVTTTLNFAGAQWSKLIVNQINALPAITGLSAQDTIADRSLRRVLTRSMREAVRVGIASDIRFAKLQGLSNGALRLFGALPLWIGQVLPLVMKWRMGSTPNPGSTLQSIRRGQKTEIDYLNGAIADAALAAGTSAPVNAALVALVHEVEGTGVFLTPEQVVARIPAG
ncbi:2-dehydropantoate 2-reductase [Leifsonia bigeumensis]|uniref:2-dehydropantoate 2-reductase n=1 Tax=Leifsonella bigeumensis TaxID=433643 RepID=A0ABP7FT12_9MICO